MSWPTDVLFKQEFNRLLSKINSSHVISETNLFIKASWMERYDGERRSFRLRASDMRNALEVDLTDMYDYMSYPWTRVFALQAKKSVSPCSRSSVCHLTSKTSLLNTAF